MTVTMRMLRLLSESFNAAPLLRSVEDATAAIKAKFGIDSEPIFSRKEIDGFVKHINAAVESLPPALRNHVSVTWQRGVDLEDADITPDAEDRARSAGWFGSPGIRVELHNGQLQAKFGGYIDPSERVQPAHVVVSEEFFDAMDRNKSWKLYLKFKNGNRDYEFVGVPWPGRK